MILNSLYLKNIRSYQELELDFQTGTSLFEGDIGSGKSTILMAIEFALFGLGGIKGNSLMRTGEKDGIVRLGFSVDGEKYEVQRRLKRARTRVSQSSNGCYITDSQGKLPLSPSELKPKILDILNFNEPTAPRAKSVIFTYAIFTPQEEMKSIISENAEKRLQTLRKAFRIEDYKITADNASLLYKEIEKKAIEFKGASGGLKEDETKKIDSAKEITKDKKRILPLEKKEKDESKEREKIQADIEKKRQKRLQLTEVAGKIPVIEKQITVNEKEIDRLDKVVEETEKEADKAKIEIDNLKKITKPTEKTTHDIDSEIKEIDKEDRKLRRREGALDGKIEEYKTVEEKGTCPTCDRPADPKEFKDKVKSKESEKKKLETELKALEESKKNANELLKKLKDYEKAQEDLEKLEKQFGGHQDSITESKKRIKELGVQVKDDKSFVKGAKKKHEQLKELELEIKNLMGQDKKKEASIKKISGDLSALRESINKSEQFLVELVKTIETKKKKKLQSEKLYEYVVWIREYFIPTISLIETSVLASINEEFNEKFREWFGILVEDTTKDARIDEDFTPIVEQDGYEQDLQYLSGGEKTSVALAYRLSLNSLVQKVSSGMKSNLLILDEPTDGFSKEQLYKVRDILNELKCPQVILVSHERELESFADHIYRVEKNNGISVVKA